MTTTHVRAVAWLCLSPMHPARPNDQWEDLEIQDIVSPMVDTAMVKFKDPLASRTKAIQVSLRNRDSHVGISARDAG